MKQCNKCKVTLELSMFNKDKNSKDGLSPICKTCRRAYRVTFYANNQDRLIKEASEYQAANPDKAKIKCEKYRKTHIDKEKARHKKYQEDNANKIRERMAKYRKEHSDILRIKAKLYAIKNKETLNQKAREYRQTHKGRTAAHCRLRQARKRNATPAWANFEAMALIYATSASMTADTGVPHHVDHIIPLTHPLVCGLHVETNLQILTASENCAKHNFFTPYFTSEKGEVSP